MKMLYQSAQHVSIKYTQEKTIYTRDEIQCLSIKYTQEKTIYTRDEIQCL